MYRKAYQVALQGKQVIVVEITPSEGVENKIDTPEKQVVNRLNFQGSAPVYLKPCLDLVHRVVGCWSLYFKRGV